MPVFPEPSALTSHRPPALMIAELIEANATGGRTRVLNADGLDALQLTEACAQSVAVIQGHLRREQGGSAASGMLVGVKHAVMTRPAMPGEAIEIHAQREYAWNSFQFYGAIASTPDGTRIFSGQFTTASPTLSA